eukprot:215882-Chlamydomonas_euryale.AAC.1
MDLLIHQGIVAVHDCTGHGGGPVGSCVAAGSRGGWTGQECPAWRRGFKRGAESTCRFAELPPWHANSSL